jgi:hypothetical protein
MNRWQANLSACTHSEFIPTTVRKQTCRLYCQPNLRIDTPRRCQVQVITHNLNLLPAMSERTRTTKEESKLLYKIDWFILSYCCLMVRF